MYLPKLMKINRNLMGIYWSYKHEGNLMGIEWTCIGDMLRKEREHTENVIGIDCVMGI